MSRRTAAEETQAALIAAGLGAVAGILAAAATSRFQAAWGRAHLPPTATPPSEPPPTELLAEDVCKALTGRALPRRQVSAAGALVHYAMGAVLGAAYALLKRQEPEVGAVHGTAFGLGVWMLVEEVGLALLRLKPPPWEVAPAEHVFAAASHLVFGLSLDTAFETLSPPSRP